jgi:hypothetical protein
MSTSIFGIGDSLTAIVAPFRDTQFDWPALTHLSERQIARTAAHFALHAGTTY